MNRKVRREAYRDLKKMSKNDLIVLYLEIASGPYIDDDKREHMALINKVVGEKYNSHLSDVFSNIFVDDYQA